MSPPGITFKTFQIQLNVTVATTRTRVHPHWCPLKVILFGKLNHQNVTKNFLRTHTHTGHRNIGKRFIRIHLNKGRDFAGLQVVSKVQDFKLW